MAMSGNAVTCISLSHVTVISRGCYTSDSDAEEGAVNSFGLHVHSQQFSLGLHELLSPALVATADLPKPNFVLANPRNFLNIELQM